MTKYQIKQINDCSSGTIAGVTGLKSYKKIAEFQNWLYKHGESIPGEENLLKNLENAALAFKLSAEVK